MPKLGCSANGSRLRWTEKICCASQDFGRSAKRDRSITPCILHGASSIAGIVAEAIHCTRVESAFYILSLLVSTTSGSNSTSIPMAPIF